MWYYDRKQNTKYIPDKNTHTYTGMYNTHKIFQEHSKNGTHTIINAIQRESTFTQKNK